MMSLADIEGVCRILLVIAEASERGRYRELLGANPKPQYRVTEASTAEEALAILAQLPVDCVLLSARLTDLTTAETLARLNQPVPDAPRAVILLVPSEQARSAHHSIQLGVQDVLVEDPQLSPESLELAVAKSLERARLASLRGGRLRELQETVEDLGGQISLRDEFLSIAAHELKTPIAAAKLKFQTSLKILGNLGTAGVPAEKLTQLMQDGDRQMSRLSRLIDNLLDLSRLESGQLTLHPQKVDLASLVREVVGRFAHQFAYAGCAVSVEAPARLEGEYDPDRLDQVVTNLMTNAIRYASGKPVRIVLRATEVTAGPAIAELAVTDGGPGVEPAMREKIFERYERAGMPTRVRGLGLGLFITREIVNAHGGSIHVEAAPGAGARFVVRLPIKPS